ncbi:MAG: NPCBM/NEW2 domain-containing protein [bacterium]
MTNRDFDYASVVGADEMADARTWLADMLEAVTGVDEGPEPKVICRSQGWGTLQINKAVGGMPLCLAGKQYKTGLGTHVDSEIVIQLPAPARKLTCLCGTDDNPHTRECAGALDFSIRAGGEELWRSGPKKVADEPSRVNLKLAGCRSLTLKVTGPLHGGHANWVDLKITLANGRTVLIGKGKHPACFSFTYGGKPSAALLPTWSLKKQRLPEKDGIILHRITRADPKTGLTMICEIKEYTRFPVVEWGLRFRNTSSRKTLLLENILSLDTTLTLGRFTYLNHWTGDYGSPDGYEPFRVSLAHGEEYRFAPMGGRPTNRSWPYYNLECPDTDRGMIAVVGWSGQWASSFRGLDQSAVRITAGQELTHFKLMPGEEARTPLSVLMFYRGDVERSQNLWRRWFMAHNLPRPGGQPMKPHLACCGTDEGEEFTAATEENQIRYITKFNEHGIHPDVWWIDAGWYPCYHDSSKCRRWWATGTWEPDAERFPRGLKPVSDYAAKAGADLLLWFEPERVTAGSKLDIERPEWLLHSGNDWSRLLNLGNPKCRKWLTDHVCRLIRENGIKIYRQDFNIEPLAYWRQDEAPDRQGMTENLYVQGYLRYWDDLLARNPGLWLDSCASGGRRNDLETMRLSVPLHYSDCGYGDHPVKLAFQRALHAWIPYFKDFTLSWDLKGNVRFDPAVDSFSFHCGMAPMLFVTMDIRRDDYDFALAAKMIGVWRRAADLILSGDTYALTPYHRSNRQWVARQFDRPEDGRGFIQAIRLPQAPEESLVIYPRGLKPDAVYRFENPETGETRELSGATLLENGFVCKLPKRAGAIWFYQRQ